MGRPLTRLLARQAFPLAVTVAAFLLLGLFLLYPLASVFQASVLDSSGTHLTLGNYAKVLDTRFYRSSLVNSLVLAGLTTAACLVLGVPMAFCLARLRLPGKSLLLALVVLPLVLPSFVGAYAWVLLLGRSGVVSQALGLGFGPIYGLPGLVLVLSLHAFPYVLLPTLAAFKAIDASLEEASQSLGVSPARTVLRVILPTALPAILAGGLLVFMETLENFGVPAILAEDTPYLAVQAYKLFVGEVGANPATAGVLAVLLVLCTTAALLVQRLYLARRRYATAARRTPPELAAGPGVRIAAAVFTWGVVLAALVPFFVVVVVSFLRFRGPVLQGDLTLDNFAILLARSSRPLWNTLLLASLAALAAAVVGVPIGYVLTRFRSGVSHVLDVVAMTPFAVAGTVLGIGLVLAFNAGPLALTGGALILVIAYAVRKLPFNVRASSAILHAIDPSLEEASVNLGVSPWRTFATLTLPMMAGGVVGGIVLTWVTVVSELSATVVLYSGPWTTMTIAMYQALEGTSAGAAAAAATMLIAATLLPLLLVWRLLRRHEAALL